MSSYIHSLPADKFEGEFLGFKVIWGDTAKNRLAPRAQELGVPVATLKALTEHYLWECANRIGCAQINVLACPHDFTTNSATGARKPDPNHVSGRLSGALPNGKAGKGRYNVHVYIQGEGKGATGYDHITVKGERVIEKDSNVLRPDLSSGVYPPV
ncbi:hypothetical protein F5Y17DRAFT_192766 [Xylariaceae sp. FL0594]|nr:hypothetical protein F5Y17DRAFT_192766 [Xylariaceae sp. FL0594]